MYSLESMLLIFIDSYRSYSPLYVDNLLIHSPDKSTNIHCLTVVVNESLFNHTASAEYIKANVLTKIND